MYRILDGNGNKVGVPIKASAIYCKPTMSFLEKQYPLNEIGRSKYKGHIKNVIDHKLSGTSPIDLAKFCLALEREGIKPVLRLSDNGQLYGITYVDHTTKCVFNGSTLGKQYSAKGILERCGSQETERNKPSLKNQNITASSKKTFSETAITQEDPKDIRIPVDILLKPENIHADYIPGQFRKKKRRRSNDK